MSEGAVYYRFETTKQDGTKVKLRIQESRQSDIVKVLDFVFKYYINEESFIRASRISQSKEALEEKRRSNHRLLAEGSVPALLVCVDNDSEDMEIVACNLFSIFKKGEVIDYDSLGTTPELKSLYRIVKEILKVYDVFKYLEVDTYICGLGMSVDPSYRGCGIATELLRARKILLKRTGVPLTGAWFTSTASQAAARKAGYTQVADIEFEELGRRARVQFDEVPTKCVLSILRA